MYDINTNMNTGWLILQTLESLLRITLTAHDITWYFLIYARLLVAVKWFEHNDTWLRQNKNKNKQRFF